MQSPETSEPVLSVSIVVYRSDPDVLLQTLQSLQQCLLYAENSKVLSCANVHIVCNDDSAERTENLLKKIPPVSAVQFAVMAMPGNVGYGLAHNRIIVSANSDFHLILNPDVVLERDCVTAGLEFLTTNPLVSAVSPHATEETGQQQFLCKRYPTVLDLLLRGFAPAALRQRFRQRLADYEMQDLADQSTATPAPIISGCFMLFRTPLLQRLQGFNPDYFLYFEDFDLSLRASKIGPLMYVPAMSIVHSGGNSASKGLRHILLFVRSGIRFFNTWGWRLW